MNPGYTGNPTDRQAIFDFVWAALTQQGERCVEKDDDYCIYRGDGGKCCAAGWMIPDSEYKQEWEGESVITPSECCDEWIVTGPSKWFEAKGFDVQFISDLQDCHDLAEGDFVPEFQGKMRKLAAEYNLTVPAA
jgi:hypothetical protein